MYDKYHIDHCDALEYLFNNWGTFPDSIPEGGLTRDISIAYFKTWRFVRTLQGEIVFGNCISPGVTRQEFESYVEKVAI